VITSGLGQIAPIDYERADRRQIGELRSDIGVIVLLDDIMHHCAGMRAAF
jgi:hypothetical protein